ncbi:hypothetical protein N5V81_12855 [Escherichia coli]|nr:hypothetical protein [Escherichia coli]
MEKGVGVAVVRSICRAVRGRMIVRKRHCLNVLRTLVKNKALFGRDVIACVVGSVVSWRPGWGYVSMDIVEHDTTLLHVTKLTGWLVAMTMLPREFYRSHLNAKGRPFWP